MPPIHKIAPHRPAAAGIDMDVRPCVGRMLPLFSCAAGPAARKGRSGGLCAIIPCGPGGCQSAARVDFPFYLYYYYFEEVS